MITTQLDYLIHFLIPQNSQTQFQAGRFVILADSAGSWEVKSLIPGILVTRDGGEAAIPKAESRLASASFYMFEHFSRAAGQNLHLQDTLVPPMSAVLLPQDSCVQVWDAGASHRSPPTPSAATAAGQLRRCAAAGSHAGKSAGNPRPDSWEREEGTRGECSGLSGASTPDLIALLQPVSSSR